MKFSFSRFLVLAVAVVSLIPQASAQVVEIPDSNLEKVIREELQLPDNISITQQEMLRLTWLPAHDKGIIDLRGLEHATNLQSLDLGGNQITDIRPLANLIQLTWLSLWHNHVEDITPLANLTKLRTLDLSYNYNIESLEPLRDLIQLEVLNFTNNRVKDITPLANMIRLKYLELRYNQVGDLTPLANLVNLEELYIKDNLANDITPLQGLNLIKLSYDEVCDIPPFPPPARERIESRSFPSVFQTWGHVLGQDHLTVDQRYALHDLFWNQRHEWGIGWDTTPTEPTYGLATSLQDNSEYVRQVRQQWLEINPNMVFLANFQMHNHFVTDAFPPNSDFWLRDAQDQIVKNSYGEYLIDFLKPEVQDLHARRIVAIARCGPFDGVMIDGFLGNATGFVGRQFYGATDEEIIQATLNIIRTARSQVRDDFLIIVNANDTKPTRYADLINGIYMETGIDHPYGYTYNRLRTIESVLLWSEKNLRSPQITCLQGRAMNIEPLDGPNNLRWMRVFTTMSLTHSDGYVIYNSPQGHLWYLFWDTNLGRPVGPKAQPYQNIEGIYIREFTNGWAVYNRSGNAQTITLPASATPVSDRGNNAAFITHLLPDLDGEIYLKAKNPADVNGDWEVNVLDLVQVANGLGTATPDPNGDGVVNILDLVFVAQSFSQ